MAMVGGWRRRTETSSQRIFVCSSLEDVWRKVPGWGRQGQGPHGPGLALPSPIVPKKRWTMHARYDFIMGLEHQYNAIVGEGGHTLSGGQRQRLSIARAILKNTPILILDEASSNIDNINERLIQEALV